MTFPNVYHPANWYDTGPEVAVIQDINGLFLADGVVCECDDEALAYRGAICLPCQDYPFAVQFVASTLRRVVRHGDATWFSPGQRKVVQRLAYVYLSEDRAAALRGRFVREKPHA